MDILCYAFTAYYVILFVRIILSWVTVFWSPPSYASPVVRVIYDLTEPVLSLFRRFIPPVGGFDFSPIFVFIVLGLIMSQLGCQTIF